MTHANWIRKAIKKPGSFTKQAQRAGQSVKSFTKSVLNNPSKFSQTTIRRARLAKTLTKLRRKKKLNKYIIK